MVATAVAVVERPVMSVEQLITLWADRLEAVRTDPRIPVGCIVELIAETIPRLKQLQQLEAGR